MLRSSLALFAMLSLLAACGTPETSPRVGPGFVNGKPVHPTVKMGDPYRINGETYVPKYEPAYVEEGMASWYGPGFHGKSTANGERFDTAALTAAHRTLPMPSMVKVTNLSNGKSIMVRVNDRGPFAHNRIIDLSKAAAEKLDMIRTGTAKVRVEYMPAETEKFISHLSGGASPERLQVDMDRGGEYQVASNNDSWYKAASAPSKTVSQATIQAADYSQVTESELPPLQPAAAAPVQATVPSPPAMPNPVMASPPAVSDGNRSYPHSPFDAVNTKAAIHPATPPPAAQPVTSPPPATGDPAPVASASGSYIQVGAFSNRANAEKVKAQFPGAFVEGSPSGAPTIFRVRIGPLADRYSAESMLSDVRTKVPEAQLIHH